MPDPAAVSQGLELLEVLSSPDLLAELADGFAVAPDGRPQLNPLLSAQPDPLLRGRVALYLLAHAVPLTFPRLDLSRDVRIERLEQLSALRGHQGPLTLRISGVPLDQPFPDGLTLTGLELSLAYGTTSLPRLDNLSALTALQLNGYGSAPDLSVLAGCQRLHTLSLASFRRELDFAFLPELPLRDLTLEQMPLRDLGCLRGLSLTRLKLSALQLGSLRGLGAHTGLRSLLVHQMSGVGTELAAMLPRFLALRTLSVRGVTVPADFDQRLASPHLHTLWLWQCDGLSSLSGLQQLPALRTLHLRHDGALDHAPLRGIRRFLDGVGVSPSGAPQRDGAPLEGSPLYTALLIDPPPGEPHPLATATTVDLTGASVSDLSRLADMPLLHTVRLGRLGPGTALAPLALLPRLQRLQLPGARPKAPRYNDRSHVIGRSAVHRWQRKQLLLLAQREPHTPQQAAWLARPAAVEMLGDAPTVDIDEALKRLDSSRRADLVAGLTQLRDAPWLEGSLLHDIHLTNDGELRVDEGARREPHLRRRRWRAWVALMLLHQAGALDPATAIHLGPRQPLEDLAPLEGLPQLESLRLRGGLRDTDLSVLHTLPKLSQLDLKGCLRLPPRQRVRLHSREAIAAFLAEATPLTAQPAAQPR